MIDIPLNKALVAEKRKSGKCTGCWFEHRYCGCIHCSSSARKDGENVIFKLVDLSEEEKHGTARII